MLLSHCRTQLVGHTSESAGQIKKCVDDWVTAGLANGQAFAVAGSNLTVSLIHNIILPHNLSTGASILPQ